MNEKSVIQSITTDLGDDIGARPHKERINKF